MLQVFNKFSSELTFENVCLYLCLCLYVSVSGGGRGGRVGKVRGGSGFKYSQKVRSLVTLYSIFSGGLIFENVRLLGECRRDGLEK